VEGACPGITQECAYLISDSYAYDFIVAKLPNRQLRLASFPGSVFGICQVKSQVLEQELRRFQTRLEEIENGIEGDIVLTEQQMQTVAPGVPRRFWQYASVVLGIRFGIPTITIFPARRLSHSKC